MGDGEEASGGGVRLRTLGTLALLVDGVPQQLGGPRQRAVLAELALDANRTVTVDRIISDLWDDDERRQPRNNVQVYVSNLRRVLRPVAERLWIAGDAGGYRLDATPGVLDWSEFRAGVERSRDQLARGLAAASADTAAAALALWHGPFLADLAVSFDRFSTAADHAESLRLDATEHWIEARIEAGATAGLVAELEVLTREHPMREPFWAQLMRALALAGRQRDALLVYQRARTVLGEEAGLEPGAELRRLEAALLAGDDARVRPARGGLHLAYADATGAVLRVALVAGTTYRIGRSPDLDIAIPWDARASREHATVHHEGGTWWVRDLGSTNGTTVNGRPVERACRVDAGDVILVGATAFALRDPAAATAVVAGQTVVDRTIVDGRTGS